MGFLGEKVSNHTITVPVLMMVQAVLMVMDDDDHEKSNEMIIILLNDHGSSVITVFGYTYHRNIIHIPGMKLVSALIHIAKNVHIELDNTQVTSFCII